MRAIDFGGVTNHLGRPVDWDENKNGHCDSLPVMRTPWHGIPSFISIWKPSIAELNHLLKGGHVRLLVVGETHPPVSLDVLEPGAEA
jgi:hypothetical protein